MTVEKKLEGKKRPPRLLAPLTDSILVSLHITVFEKVCGQTNARHALFSHYSAPSSKWRFRRASKYLKFVFSKW